MSGNETQSINSHIEDYLDYYCGLHSPGFAVLLKGEWGCGKTWFINKYLEKLKQEKQKSLYVSLYGMTSFSEIEDSFFQQLHPILSSKGMAIIGKILKGSLKATLRVDLDRDLKDDDSFTVGIPEINLPDYLKNTDKSILVFDDLERCQIDIGNLLGYINSFVEHQELKVIIVANEEKLLKENNYKEIKEKLIGKTFDVCFDLDNSLKDFIKETENDTVKDFLSNNIQLIEEIYEKAEYKNLRCLKQIILDFERIFEELPDKAKNKSELLQEILQILIAFSIEIRRGKLSPKNISKLQEAQYYKVNEAKRNAAKRRSSNSQSNSSQEESFDDYREQDNIKDPASLKKIIDRYSILSQLIYDPLLTLEWWQMFFDQGVINASGLEDSILNSKYFQDENMSNWIKLWHFEKFDMTDNEFIDLLEKVESEYANRVFQDTGVIIHITGLFLHLSDIELYSKNKQDILQNSKLYIDHLLKNNKLDLDLSFRNDLSLFQSFNYEGLPFLGTEIKEFKTFCLYIDAAKQSAREKNFPQLGQELLDIMQKDKFKFDRMICSHNISDYKDWDRIYCQIPIFKYIETKEFINKFLSMNSYDKYYCIQALIERYKSIDINKELLEELEWLKNVQNLLLDKADRNKGKLSGYKLQLLNKELNQAIEKLEPLSTNQEVIE